MLSIIVSSHKEDLYNNLVLNVAKTIGIEHEMIRIPNYGEMSIGQAYNKGADKSQFPYLLFLHEDVEFLTENWGEKLIAHLNLEKVGVVGLAGSNYVPQVPNDWFTCGPHNFINVIHHDSEIHNNLSVPLQEVNQVYSLDGVFLGIKKSVFLEFKFDENILGFHSYDLSISLRIARKYYNYVISNIKLLHFSDGKPDKNWFLSNIKIREEVGSDFNFKKVDYIEYLAFKRFIMNNNKFEGSNLVRFKSNIKFYPKFDHFRILYHLKLIYFITKSLLVPRKINFLK